MKTFRKIMSIAFALTALLWENILLKTFLYEVSRIHIGTTAVIGAPDKQTFSAVTIMRGPVILLLLSWLLSMTVFSVLNIIKAFKRTTSKSLDAAVAVSFVIMVIVAVITPPQRYILAVYTTFRFLMNQGVHWVSWSFYAVSGIAVILTALSLLPLKRMK